MICNAVYDNETDVPAAFKADFHRRADGKWVMNDDAVPGAAEILNPGLAANRDRALQQKATADEQKRAADERARAAEAELANVRAPGAVVLSPEDAKAWKRFQELGDVKTVERIVKTDFPRLQQTESLRAQEVTFRQAAEDLKEFGVNLNVEVLTDLMTHPQRGEGLTIERRLTEVDDGKGGKTKVNFPFVVKRVPVQGKENEFTNEATPLLDFAKTSWPSWASTALTSGAAAGGESGGDAGGSTGQAGGGFLPLGTGTSGGGAQAGGGGAAGGLRLPGAPDAGLKLPRMGGGSTGGGGGSTGASVLDGAKMAEEFNAQRDRGRTSPLLKGRQAPQQQQTGGGSDANAQK